MARTEGPALGYASMPSINDLRQELDDLTRTISTHVRTVAFSVLGSCWALLLQGGASADHGKFGPAVVLPPLAISFMALVFDLLQYYFGMLHNKNLLRQAERARATEIFYDVRDLRYRLRGYCFDAKIWCVVISALWLFVGVAIEVWF